MALYAMFDHNIYSNRVIITGIENYLLEVTGKLQQLEHVDEALRTNLQFRANGYKIENELGFGEQSAADTALGEKEHI